MYNREETLDIIKSASVKKSSLSIPSLLILGFFAGLMIAFAALISTIASMNLLSNPDTYGLGKLVQGIVFSGGLVMVVLGGAELFTGNSLMLIGLLSHSISLKGLVKNWTFVLLGNALGAAFLALLASLAGIYSANSGLLGTTLSNIATAKASLPFGSALILGILCNILVCLAVFMAFSAKSFSGKFLSCLFPVTFFVAAGFEHSIANFFYLPAGFIASGSYTFGSLSTNLIPVILGNIIGGALIVACGYYFSSKNAKIK